MRGWKNSGGSAWASVVHRIWPRSFCTMAMPAQMRVAQPPRETTTSADANGGLATHTRRWNYFDDEALSHLEQSLKRIPRRRLRATTTNATTDAAPPDGTTPSAAARASRRAAVLVPLCNRQGKASVLFTRRAETLKLHKGEVSDHCNHISFHIHLRSRSIINQSINQSSLMELDGFRWASLVGSRKERMGATLWAQRCERHVRSSAGHPMLGPFASWDSSTRLSLSLKYQAMPLSPFNSLNFIHLPFFEKECLSVDLMLSSVTPVLGFMGDLDESELTSYMHPNEDEISMVWLSSWALVCRCCSLPLLWYCRSLHCPWKSF